MVESVGAVVLTHRRPRLATAVVRSLIDTEGVVPQNVTVVVNEEGGLDDAGLERAVRMVRLSTNTGPAGGFRTGLLAAFEDPAVQWAYLCEDDIGLFDLPTPRLRRVLSNVNDRAGDGPIGAVVAYGRRLVGRGHAANVVPAPGDPALVPVDVAPWGATLVARQVVDRGVLPDDRWFFGYEDFDFFCKVRGAGFHVLVDSLSARAVAHQQTSAGRNVALRDNRPADTEEAWRAYYTARNFFHLARAHGRKSWMAWHVAYSVRRMQLAHSNVERRALLHGLIDGVSGRMGPHPKYLRQLGERSRPPPGAGLGLGAVDPGDRTDGSRAI